MAKKRWLVTSDVSIEVKFSLFRTAKWLSPSMAPDEYRRREVAKVIAVKELDHVSKIFDCFAITDIENKVKHKIYLIIQKLVKIEVCR